MSTESTDPVEPPASVAPETPETTHAAAPAPEEPEESQGKPWLKFAIVGILAIVLIGGGVYLFTSLNSYAAGDCVSATPNNDDEGTWKLDSAKCDATNASYKIAKMLNSPDDPCPEEGIYEGIQSDKKSMCLMPNLVEGQCYSTDEAGAFKKEACSPESTVKIVKKVDGLPEEGTVCPEPSTELRFSEPAQVYCMGVQE